MIVAWKRAYFFACVGAPKADHAVVPPGQNLVSISGEDDAANIIFVARKATHLSPGGEVPNANGIVKTPGYRASAIGSKSHGPHPAGMAIQAFQFLAGF